MRTARPLPAALALCAALAAAPVRCAGLSCKLDARYAPSRRSVEGTLRMDWTNPGPRAVSSVVFLLPLNALRNTRSAFWQHLDPARRGEAMPSRWADLTISRALDAAGNDLSARMRFLHPDDSDADDRTVAELPLATPLAPGATLRLTLDFVARLPSLLAGTGSSASLVVGNGVFPVLAAFRGGQWVAHETRPGASPTVEPADLEAALDLPASDKGHVAGSIPLAEERDAPGGRVIERFVAAGARGFAFFADPGADVTTSHPGGAAALDWTWFTAAAGRRGDVAAARLGAERAAAALREAAGPLRTTALTVAVLPPRPAGVPDLPVPGAVLLHARSAPSPGDRAALRAARETARAIARLEFPVDETASPALARGIARALGDLAAGRVRRPVLLPLFGMSVPLPFPGPTPVEATQLAFLRARRDPEGADAMAAALAIESLGGAAGPERMRAVWRGLAAGPDGAALRRDDFLSAVGAVLGPAWRATMARCLEPGARLDYRVQSASCRRAEGPAGYWTQDGREREIPGSSRQSLSGFDSEVVIRRSGSAPFPVEIVLDFAGRKSYRTTWDGAGRRLALRCSNGPPLESVRIDPDSRVPFDADPLDNGVRVRSDATAANLWTARLYFWTTNAVDLFMELW